ncbi:MAG: glutamate--tRNA ligase, partial [Saprospiraceae bacterium]|nr:glutamate--tRNA ligase [Saprospiraceae bacterium]
MSTVRVRFAPSPTGPLHIGGVRTALYNYLFAKKHNGTFILRVEDTDQTRYVPGAEDYIKQSLNWAGLELDEGPDQGGEFGPYRQSERKALYAEYTNTLIDNGWAYRAFDTPEELDAKREAAKAAGNHSWQYDSTTRLEMKNSLTLSKEEEATFLAAGTPFAVRFKIPKDETVEFVDEIRGKVSFQTNVLDDKVLYKADGMPTYHMANVIDDHHMAISHVIRGEEWLPSTPLHVLLYKAFGWEHPAFAHLPLILKPQGQGKLSKRDGAKFGFPVFPLVWQDGEESWAGYRETGFYPDGFNNMLAFLGWNPGTDQEIFSLEELIEAFDLEKVSKSGARFDYDKAKWFNQQHLIQKDDEAIAIDAHPYFAEAGMELSAETIFKVVQLYKERV